MAELPALLQVTKYLFQEYCSPPPPLRARSANSIVYIEELLVWLAAVGSSLRSFFRHQALRLASPSCLVTLPPIRSHSAVFLQAKDDVLRAAFRRLTQPAKGATYTPAELVVLLNQSDARVPLKSMTRALTLCLENKVRRSGAL